MGRGEPPGCGETSLLPAEFAEEGYVFEHRAHAGAGPSSRVRFSEEREVITSGGLASGDREVARVLASQEEVRQRVISNQATNGANGIR